MFRNGCVMKKFTLVLCSLLLSACTVASSLSTVHPAHSATQEAARALLNQAVTEYHAQDYAQALPLFRQAEQAGDMKAPRYLGLMSLNGQGVPRDAAQAFTYFQQAASKGDITGQYWLGYCYENAIGTAQNLALAKKWYEQSAQRGDVIAAPAMVALGRLYEQGKGVAADHQQALAYYQQAKNAGDAQGEAEWQRLQTAH